MGTKGKWAVLVAEQRGDWCGWVEPLREAAEQVVVILQRCGETPAELATRVRERAQELRAEGGIAAAALVGGASFDDATLSARARIVRTVVTQMVEVGGGRVYLDGSAQAGRGRHAMAALAAVVEDHVNQTGVELVSAQGVPAVAPAGLPRAA